MVVSNTVGKGDTRTRKGTHMGQSFVRVNRVIGEKKKVATVKSRESLFRRDAIEIDVGSNAFRERRLGRAPGTELLEAAAEARDAPVRPRCADGTQTYAGRLVPRPVSRARKASARSTFCLGGRALVPLTGRG
jgi:hypothetical protein